MVLLLLREVQQEVLEHLPLLLEDLAKTEVEQKDQHLLEIVELTNPSKAQVEVDFLDSVVMEL